jgi:membrane-associated protease RseP (regulator of RpoE activity)
MPVESVNYVEAGKDAIRVPAPTAWPIALAFGITLLFAGMVTNQAVSALGAIVAVAGAVGWFREVLPHEAHETVAVIPGVAVVTTSRREVLRMEIAGELLRAYLPLEIYPISAGVKGGLAGSVAMAVVAMLYGLISQHSVWYAINLLAAGFLPGAMTENTAEIAAFNLSTFLIATTIHLITSLLVGLLYGAMLPMFPRRPILLGGFIAPLFWTGLIHSILGVVNPVLNQRIEWLLFVASQVVFGIVAGIVVSRQERIRTWQRLPLAVRSGIEASGMEDESR